MNKYLDLYLTFARIGGLTFGGGYAMLPILQKEVVEKKGWSTESELMDYYAIGQCTPGIIAVNTATFVGENTAGTMGGIIATLGVVSPSIIIIGIIAALVNNFMAIELVQHAFNGIRVCVIVLMINAVCKLSKTSIVDKFTLFIFISIIIATSIFEISPMILVFLAAISGIIYSKAKGN